MDGFRASRATRTRPYKIRPKAVGHVRCILGKIAIECWRAIPNHFDHVTLDEFVIMPNHVHGILVIEGDWTSTVRARHAVPVPDEPYSDETHGTEQFGKPLPGSIPTIVRSFKSAASQRINELRGTPGTPIWHRNYYEHVIRSEESLRQICQYIADNPAHWADDRENPERRRSQRWVIRL
jgi:REP element-mobilizing transposase RayT